MSKIRLLIVDDDAVTRQTVANCFHGEPGIEVIACSAGEQVIPKLSETEGVVWLLVDWNMPGMTGYELLHAVRADPRFDRISIMMLTSETSIAHVQRALIAGADEYLMKPFTKEMLLGKLALLHFK